MATQPGLRMNDESSAAEEQALYQRVAVPLSPWAEVVGPCYTVASFSRVTRMKQDEVGTAAAELRVLLLVTADGEGLLPSFQVREGEVASNLRPVLEALRSGVDDPWTWAQWLNAEVGADRSPIDRLWAGEFEGTLSEAKHDAWAWRS